MDASYKEQLLSLCMVQSHSSNEKRMVVYIYNTLRELNLSPEIDKVGNILVTKGHAKTYPCIVSHLDTVHRIEKHYELKEKETKLGLMLYAKSGKSRTGVGGDDKCGIFACLYFLQVLPAVKVVFFTQEETGCIGSNGIDDTFFGDCRYILQLDRRSSSDFINIYCQQKTISHAFSSEVGHVLKRYGFKSTSGVWTDSINLWDKEVGISCANISSGYYSPHTSNEYIIVEDLWNSILFTRELITTLKPKRYISLPTSKTINIKTKYNIKSRKEYLGIYKKKCENCGKKTDFYKLLNNKIYCYGCLQWDCITTSWALKSATKSSANTLKTKIQVLQDLSLIKTPVHPIQCDVCSFWTKESNGKAALGLGFICNRCLIDMS